MRGATVFSDWIGRRIVALAGRYIWRGKLVEERGPFALLTDACQVLDHSASEIREEQRVGEVRLNAGAIEAIYLEASAAWVPKETK